MNGVTVLIFKGLTDCQRHHTMMIIVVKMIIIIVAIVNCHHTHHHYQGWCTQRFTKWSQELIEAKKREIGEVLSTGSSFHDICREKFFSGDRGKWQKEKVSRS